MREGYILAAADRLASSSVTIGDRLHRRLAITNNSEGLRMVIFGVISICGFPVNDLYRFVDADQLGSVDRPVGRWFDSYLPRTVLSIGVLWYYNRCVQF